MRYLGVEFLLDLLKVCPRFDVLLSTTKVEFSLFA